MGHRDTNLNAEVRFLCQRYDVNTQTVKVNFAEQEQLMDDRWANACVRVHTSDGVTGTTSHLDIGSDPAQFATDLKANVGAGLPVILEGGDSGSQQSRALQYRLHRELAKEGFIVAPLDDITHNDIGGKIGRKAILRRSGVEVIKNGSVQNGKNLILRFPK